MELERKELWMTITANISSYSFKNRYFLSSYWTFVCNRCAVAHRHTFRFWIQNSCDLTWICICSVTHRRNRIPGTRLWEWFMIYIKCCILSRKGRSAFTLTCGDVKKKLPLVAQGVWKIKISCKGMLFTPLSVLLRLAELRSQNLRRSVVFTDWSWAQLLLAITQPVELSNTHPVT